MKTIQLFACLALFPLSSFALDIIGENNIRLMTDQEKQDYSFVGNMEIYSSRAGIWIPRCYVTVLHEHEVVTSADCFQAVLDIEFENMRYYGITEEKKLLSFLNESARISNVRLRFLNKKGEIKLYPLTYFRYHPNYNPGSLSKKQNSPYFATSTPPSGTDLVYLRVNENFFTDTDVIAPGMPNESYTMNSLKNRALTDIEQITFHHEYNQNHSYGESSLQPYAISDHCSAFQFQERDENFSDRFTSDCDTVSSMGQPLFSPLDNREKILIGIVKSGAQLNTILEKNPDISITDALDIIKKGCGELGKNCKNTATAWTEIKSGLKSGLEFEWFETKLATTRHSLVTKYTLPEFKMIGLSARDLFDNGFTVKEIVAAGFTLNELRKSGVSATELKNQSISSYAIAQLGYSRAELDQAGLELGSLIAEAPKNEATLKLLHGLGFTATELKNAGFTFGQLKPLFSNQDLKNAGATARDFANLYVRAEELKSIGVSCSEMLKNGYSYRDLYNLKCQISELLAGGVSEKTIVDFRQFPIQELKKAGISLKTILSSGTYVYPSAHAQLKESYSLSELIDAGVFLKELTKQTLPGSGAYEGSFGYSIQEIKSTGKVSIARFLAAEFSVKSLLESGYSVSDFEKEGIHLSKLHWTVGARAAEGGGYSFKEVKEVYSLSELKRNYSLVELREKGLTLSELKREYTLNELKTAFSLQELLDGGFTKKELKAAAFTGKQIRRAKKHKD